MPPLQRGLEHGLTTGIKHLLLPAARAEHRVELEVGANAGRLVLQADTDTEVTIVPRMANPSRLLPINNLLLACGSV